MQKITVERIDASRNFISLDFVNFQWQLSGMGNGFEEWLDYHWKEEYLLFQKQASVNWDLYKLIRNLTLCSGEFLGWNSNKPCDNSSF